MSSNLKIGVELHLKLNIGQKLFCDCIYDETAPMNTHSCPICEGQPGSYPRVNSEAVKLGILAANLMNCKIPEKIQFYRKHYHYPDLPKGYQITMYKDGFLGTNGTVLVFDTYSQIGTVPITNIILEEDPCSYVKGQLNYNRAGSALLEVVSEPVFNSAKMVLAYIKTVINLLHVAGVVDKSNTKVFRADINISTTDSARTELKNLGSLDEIDHAIKAQYARHLTQKPSEQQTRSYDFLTDHTTFMRKKQSARQYAYLPQYNIRPITVKLPQEVYNVYEMFKTLKSKLVGINAAPTRLWTFANYSHFAKFIIQQQTRIAELCRLAELNLKYQNTIDLDTILNYTPETYRRKFIKLQQNCLDTVFKQITSKLKPEQLKNPKIYNYIFGNLLHKSGASYEQIKQYLSKHGL